MILGDYKPFYDKLISLSTNYIEKNGVIRGSKEKLSKHQLDYKLLTDFSFFCLTKSTKSLIAYYHLLEGGFYEDALIVARSIYENYLGNRYFEDQFSSETQSDMYTIPMGLMNGELIEISKGAVRLKDSSKFISYAPQNPIRFVIGKDKNTFNSLYPYLCTLTHCNFGQAPSYIDRKMHFTLSSKSNEAFANLIGLYVYAKIFESIILIEVMPYLDKDEEKLYIDFFIDLTLFLYGVLDNFEGFQLPDNISEGMLKKIFVSMQNSLKEQLGRVEKDFIVLLQGQNAKREGEAEIFLKIALLKSKTPSAGLVDLLKQRKLADLYTELWLLQEEQNATLFQQTMERLNRAFLYKEKVSNPYAFMLLALTCSFKQIAKQKTAETKANSQETIAPAKKHKKKKPNLAEKFLNRIMANFVIKRYVLRMISSYRELTNAVSTRASQEVFDAIMFKTVYPKDLVYLMLASNPLTEEDKQFLFARFLKVD